MSRVKKLSIVELPSTLKMDALEAMQIEHCHKLLPRLASSFADSVVPGIDGKKQFSSVQEMQKAKDINDAMWSKAFKSRFELLQQEAKVKIDLGIEPKQAIVDVYNKYTQGVNKKLLNDLFKDSKLLEAN